MLNVVKSGMIPNLIMTLTKHASLAQDVLDSDLNFRALEYLSRCKRDLETLSDLERNGKLPQAVTACHKLEGLLQEAPAPVENSKVFNDFKVSLDYTP